MTADLDVLRVYADSGPHQWSGIPGLNAAIDELAAARKVCEAVGDLRPAFYIAKDNPPMGVRLLDDALADWRRVRGEDKR